MGKSNDIYIQRSEVKKKVKKMKQAYENAMSAINDLYNNQLYKIGDIWKDKSSYEFINKFSDYLSDIKKLMDTYSQYIALLETAADEYKKTVVEANETM